MRWMGSLRRGLVGWTDLESGLEIVSRLYDSVDCMVDGLDSKVSSTLTAIYSRERERYSRRMMVASRLPIARPGSGLILRLSDVYYVLALNELDEHWESLASSSPRMTPVAAVKRKKALNRLGNAYGQCFIHQTPSFPPKTELSPNNPG